MLVEGHCYLPTKELISQGGNVSRPSNGSRNSQCLVREQANGGWKNDNMAKSMCPGTKLPWFCTLALQVIG